MLNGLTGQHNSTHKKRTDLQDKLIAVSKNNVQEYAKEEQRKSIEQLERKHNKMCRQNMIKLRKMVKNKFGTNEIIRRLGVTYWSDVANTAINEICDACEICDANSFDIEFVGSYLIGLLDNQHHGTSSLVWSNYSRYY